MSNPIHQPTKTDKGVASQEGVQHKSEEPASKKTSTGMYRKISVSESYEERQNLLRLQYERMAQEEELLEDEEASQ